MKIALSGKICSGKTTTAEYIKRIIPEKIEIFSFAGRLKELATELFITTLKIKTENFYKILVALLETLTKMLG